MPFKKKNCAGSVKKMITNVQKKSCPSQQQERLSGFPNPTEMSLVRKLNFSLDPPLTPYNPAGASKWVYAEPAHELTYLKSNLMVFSLGRIVIG